MEQNDIDRLGRYIATHATTAPGHEAGVINAAFRAALAMDWSRVDSLVNDYPHILGKAQGGWPALWPVSLSASMRGVKAKVTWLDGGAYVVCCRDPQFARWIGYREGDQERYQRDEDVEVIWYGTQQLSDGTFAAQFRIEGSDD